jgi:hypothetical protein
MSAPQEELGYLGPRQAYEALDNYGRHYGRLPLVLLMHAAVPQSFRPDLLNLIKVNFLPEAGDDLTVDADVLFSPLIESTGAGFHRLDPEVRRQCLVLLDAAHKHSAERRSVAVARFILAYVDEMIRRPGTADDPLFTEYLTVQGWVAGAFVSPHEMASHFARALEPITQGQYPVRLHLGGLASALSIPLTGYPELIAYARALGAIETGNDIEAARLIRSLGSEALEIGGVTLRPPTELLREYSITNETPEPPNELAREHSIADETPAPPVPRNALKANTEVREVFISYRLLDNMAPPGGRDGFVNYLMRQVRARLQEDGVPDAILWQDRSLIARGDNWNEEVWRVVNRSELFIVILSKNYIRSSWCKKELHAMESRVKRLPTGERRIFRVDKHWVPENQIPEPLRSIQSVRFYREDRESNIDEFFWGGKVRLSREFDKALLELTSAIGRRLEEFGIPYLRTDPPEPRLYTRRSNGRVVFVAKPAVDMLEYYRTVVEELRGAGYRVTPDPDQDLGNHGEEVQSAIVRALAEAEASIHLLGTRTGGRPDGLNMDLVSMQLAAAAEAAKTSPGFERMIWAPTVLAAGTSAQAKTARRDPLKVLKRFGQRLLESDQIDGDTASRFNEFVLQRLERRKQGSWQHAFREQPPARGSS